MKRIYISGRTNGLYVEGVLRKFRDAACFLGTQGHEAVNPFQCAREQWLDTADHVMRNMHVLRRCDAIYMLMDWQESAEAKVEKAFAESLGLEVMYQVEAEIIPLFGVADGHEYAYLGVKARWATCNVGAARPSDGGTFFAWGETMPKSSYTESNCHSSMRQMPDITGDPLRDAAAAHWGGAWRMPTKRDLEDLISCSKVVVAEMDGKPGCRVTGPNGNSIFLPTPGYMRGNELLLEGEGAGYWTGSQFSLSIHGQSYCCDVRAIEGREMAWGWTYARHLGYLIRPVFG